MLVNDTDDKEKQSVSKPMTEEQIAFIFEQLGLNTQETRDKFLEMTKVDKREDRLLRLSIGNVSEEWGSVDANVQRAF